jgi:hypothetical protein
VWEVEGLEEKGRSGSIVPGLVEDSRRDRKKNILWDVFACVYGFVVYFIYSPRTCNGAHRTCTGVMILWNNGEYIMIKRKFISTPNS